MNKTCDSCMAFSPFGADAQGNKLGQCRLNAPTVSHSWLTDKGPTWVCSWPSVKASEWCLQHQNKLEIN